MRFYVLFLLFLAGSCSRNSRVETQKTIEEGSSNIKYHVIIETEQGASFTLMYESLKYLKPDYHKSKLELVKPKFEEDVKFPQSYTTSKQANKRVLPNSSTKISGKSTATIPIPFPSGLNLEHRLSREDDIIFIFIREFESKSIAQSYVSLIEESKYFIKGSKSFVLSEEEAFQFFIDKFTQ